MSGKLARVLTGLAVLAVAVIAAIVSFTHIASVAAGHGYSAGTARLLPFSVDGLIVAASLVLLAEARAQRPAPRLARFGLWLGICATLAANVEHGAAYGPVGALVNAWPGVAFVVASEILLGMIRRAGTTPARDDTAGTVADAVSGGLHADVPDGVPVSTVSPVPVTVPRTVAARAPAGKPKAPERVFAAEIEAGAVPSLRTIKARMRVGTDRARAIRGELAALIREVPEAA